MTTNGDVNKLIWLQFLGTISCHGKTKKQLEKKGPILVFRIDSFSEKNDSHFLAHPVLPERVAGTAAHCCLKKGLALPPTT